ncbi:hypothetical protein Bbelb_377380 [Branchiostoma belcheri]|nr:hypothetical protein Bbelb_377380 [Branchiostoma belcheri]
MAKNGLNKQPHTSFNADETGFDLDQQKKKVVTFAHMKAPAVSVRMGTREHISCLECVAADGSAISYSIFAKLVPSTAYSSEGPDNALYATTPRKSKFEDAVQKISLVRPNYFVTKSTFCKVFMYKTSREHSLTMVEKAFDSINRDNMWRILKSYGIPNKIISVLKAIYKGTSCIVRVGTQNTDKFEVRTGVRQGCILSPLLFITTIDWVLKKVKAEEQGVQVKGTNDRLLNGRTD